MDSGLAPDAPVFDHDADTNILWCSVSMPDSHFYTMREGEALSALNHIVRRIVETELGEDANNPARASFIIDINDIQKKRIENIKATAHMMAERARFFKSSIEVDPMSPFDRRIVHEFLANHKDVKTESVGAGQNRRVVIKYIAVE